jgi:hypothetical protein
VWFQILLAGLFDQELEIKYHFIRDMVQKGAVKLQYISTDEQIADHRDMVQKGAVKLQYTPTDEQIANILTKPLSKVMDK